MRATGAVIAGVAMFFLGACEAETYPLPGLPGACSGGQKACYTHPQDGREILLRCNDEAIKGTVWIVDHVCAEGEVCEQSTCAPVG